MGRALAAAAALLMLAAAAPAASAEPFVGVDDDAVIEGHSGDTPAEFVVWLSEPSDDRVIVDYATHDGSALDSSDYAPTFGQVTIPAGDIEAVVPVPVRGDALDEPDEDFTLRLVDASGATVFEEASEGFGAIVDDDPTPTLSIADAGGFGSPLVFTISLSAPSGRSVAVTAGTADGTLRERTDYWPRRRWISFPPGTTTAEFPVALTGSRYEQDRTLHVDLSEPAGATIARRRATGTLFGRPFEPPPWIAVSDAKVREGRTATVRVGIDRPFPFPLPVTYATSPGTALAGTDFVPRSGTVTIPAGKTSATLALRTVYGRRRELAETFELRLGSTRYGVALRDPVGVVTILDDPPPRLGSLSVRPGRVARFTLSERAVLRFRVERRIDRRWRRVPGVLRRTGRPGANHVRLGRWMAGRRLRPAVYRLVAVAVDRPGGRSRVRRSVFRVGA